MILVLEKEDSMNTRQTLEKQIAISRSNLLLMTILTIVNIIAYWFNSSFILPYSAFLPYTIFDFGAYFAVEAQDPSLFWIGLVLSALIIGIYFLGYFLSKHKPQWLTFMLAMYIFDTVVMIFLFTSVFLFSPIMIIDILFHGWVLYYLVIGVLAVKKLNTLSEDVLDSYK